MERGERGERGHGCAVGSQMLVYQHALSQMLVRFCRFWINHGAVGPFRQDLMIKDRA